GYEKVTWMALVGAILWGAAKLWDFNFPINKNLWTSSFVLITVGWSLMLLALFYLIIDVWKVRWWTFFFVVIGSNSLFIYLVGGFIDFEAIVSILFRKEGNWIHPDLVIVAALALKWLLLYYMYRKKIFLRL
ncbi:MAG: hypothetical protein KDA65_18965, partial [Planctomycetaceae bacterium]|nr:hypothetical protein [Planctomycetaceae bacterium]